MYRKIAFLLSTVVATQLMTVACTKKAEKASPQTTLSDYVSRTFGMTSVADKSRLVDLATGQVKAVLEKLDDEAFKSGFIDAKKEFVSLKIRDERKLAENQYSITYELTYVNTSDENKDKITNKKHALFVNENGKWLISEVHNLKTFIEHQNEMKIDL